MMVVWLMEKNDCGLIDEGPWKRRLVSRLLHRNEYGLMHIVKVMGSGA